MLKQTWAGRGVAQLHMGTVLGYVSATKPQPSARSWWLTKLVAAAPHRDDVAGLSRVALDFAPHAAYIDVDGIGRCRGGGIVTVDEEMAQQLLALHHALRMAHEVVQQPHLVGRQAHTPVAGERHDEGVRVQLHLAHTNRGTIPR